MYIIYSGRRDYLDQYYPNAILESCEIEWHAKAMKVFGLLKSRNDFDILIRFCPDAVIKDVDKLLICIKNGMVDEKTALGNKMRFSSGQRGYYLRGGCNATPKFLVHKMVFQSLEKNYDLWYSMTIKEAGGILKNWPLFEYSNKYTGRFPVWHPQRDKDFNIHIQKFKKESKARK